MTAAVTRRRWDDIPADVRAAVVHGLGSQVVKTRGCAGGYTATVAELVELANERTVFVKALPLRADPPLLAGLREEQRVNHQLLAALVATPRLAFTVEQNGWLVLVFDAIIGQHPGHTWTNAHLNELSRLLDRTARLLTPSPVDSLPTIADRYTARFTAWRDLAGGTGPDADQLANLLGLARHNLDRLAELEDGWIAATTGDTASHLDLRLDNLVIDQAGVWWIVDWSWPCLAAAWVDLVLFTPTASRGPDVGQALIETHSTTHHVDPACIDALLAAAAGAWAVRGTRPPLPSAPRLRQDQATFANNALNLLRHRGALARNHQGERWP